eukprot:2523252-Amphidinium_carterae.1
MELRWRGGELCISETYESGSGDVIGDISLCIIAVLRVRKYSDSRWLTIGVSCKTILAACLLGLCDLVAHVRAQPHTSDFYLHGFTRLSKDLKLFLVLGASVSYVGDGLLALVLEDSRLCKNQVEVKNAVLEELQYLESLAPAVLAHFASFCDMSSLEVRDAMICGAQTSYAFLHMRVFSVLQQAPWTLAQGDIHANLLSLASRSEPEESTSKKIWRLLTYKLASVDEIVSAVRLLQCLPWAATTVEQLHGSIATFRKYRPELELQNLLCRSYLHMVRSMFREDSEHVRQAKIKSRLLQLLQKRVGRITGRHAFLKAFYSAAQLLSPAETINKLPNHVMMAHGEKWSDLPVESLDYYEKMALSIEEQSLETRQSERCRLAEALQRSAERMILGQEKLSFIVSSRKEVLSQRFHSLGMKVSALQSWATELCAGVVPPGETVRSAFERCRVHEGGHTRLSGWLKHLALHRTHHEHVVLHLATETGPKYVKFVFALQRPLSVWFHALETCEQEIVLSPSESVGMPEQHQYWTSAFRYTAGEIIEGLLVSDSGPLPWKQWVRPEVFEPELPVGEEQPFVESESLDENSSLWVEEYLSAIGGRVASSSFDVGAGSDAEIGQTMPDNLSVDEVLGRAYEALRALQSTAIKQNRSSCDFKVCAVGSGVSSEQDRSSSKKGFQAFARTAIAKHFCIQGSWPRSATFTDAVFGTRVSYILSHEWCERMQTLLDSYTSKGMQWDEFLASPILHESSAEFERSLASLSGKARERAEGIPTLGPAVWMV